MYEVAGRIEIEMARRTTLRVNPANHGQLRAYRIDREDRNVIASPIGRVQELTGCVHQNFAGAAGAFKAGGQRARVFDYRSKVAIAVPEIRIERVRKLVD